MGEQARIAPLVAVPGFGDDPPRPIPGARRVVQPAKAPLLVPALRVARGGLLQKVSGQREQAGVFGQAHDRGGGRE